MNELLRRRYYYAIKKILIEQSVYKFYWSKRKLLIQKYF